MLCEIPTSPMIVSHMPVDTRLPNSDASSSHSSSIKSKLSSPWSKRSRNTYEFSIEPNEPLKNYQPGDIVTGHILLNVLKGFDITHLVIALHGYAKVYKHQQDNQFSGESLANGKGSRGFEYHGNGLASLFQDERILCGSGFLRKQVYKFGFELEFPEKSLPSSLEFERGSVAYMISATVTRPTTISPTLTKIHRIHFRDRIDIESMYTPKVRVVTLEPISRRGKMKKVKTGTSGSSENATAAIAGTSQPQGNIYPPVPPHAQIQPPHSPAPSEDTVATDATTSTTSLQILDNRSQNERSNAQASDTRSGDTSLSTHTITATTELPRHGALAGDVVNICVSVSHNKPRVRGVIIATLYRQGRVDMCPVLPLASKGKDKKKEYEDVYPTSRTGLGGLYFANGSPSSVFRKDLSQSSTMMIVDPLTLTANVKTSVKVPEDAFPTIANVPGGMITFTYHVEVVIDLTGKLGESKFLPSLTSAGPSFSTGMGNGNQITADWANSILDTSALRRMKSVVTFDLPLVIGTRDSRRAQQTQRRLPADLSEQPYHGDNVSPYGNTNEYSEYPADPYAPVYQYDGQYGNYYTDEYGNQIYDHYYDQYGPGYNYDGDGQASASPPGFVPPPEEPEPVDEKARMRRHYELLLPSQPPDAGPSASTGRDLPPSAPIMLDSVGDHLPPVALGPAANGARSVNSRASARSTETIIPQELTQSTVTSSQLVHPHGDDKQEMERQRLLAQASAPPEDDEGESSSSAPAPTSVATAPVIDEDEYLARALGRSHLEHDNLPRYQR